MTHTELLLSHAILALGFASLLPACGEGGGTGGTGGTGGSATTTTTTTSGSGGGAPGEELAALVEVTRYEADLATVAVPRTPGSAGWQAVQDLCAERFAAAGFTVERQSDGTSTNVVGTLAGADAAAEKVILSAHYDAVPECAGADDNGSGVAGLLEAARVLGQAQYARTLVVACWDEEESGLLGSRAYADAAKSGGDTIAAAFVFEMIGYKSDAPGSQSLPVGFGLLFPEQAAALEANGAKGDFIAVVGDESIDGPQAVYMGAAASLGLPAISMSLRADQKNANTFQDLRRSDHASFWAVDYPALMLTDTANFRNTHYHCTAGPDATGDLDAAFAAKVVKAAVWAVADTLGVKK